MPGNPVTIGCTVVLSPGLSGPPDTGTITSIPPGGPTANGMPLATATSLCTMINSVWGFPYQIPIGSAIPSQVQINGLPLVRTTDTIPSGPGALTIVGPPVAPFVTDSTG